MDLYNVDGMRSSFFWLFTQRMLVVVYRRFETFALFPFSKIEQFLDERTDGVFRNVCKQLPK